MQIPMSTSIQTPIPVISFRVSSPVTPSIVFPVVPSVSATPISFVTSTNTNTSTFPVTPMFTPTFPTFNWTRASPLVFCSSPCGIVAPPGGLAIRNDELDRDCRLIIRHGLGQETKVSLPSWSLTIAELKKLLSCQYHIAPKWGIKLLLDGRVLEEDKSCVYHNLQKDSVLDL